MYRGEASEIWVSLKSSTKHFGLLGFSVQCFVNQVMGSKSTVDELPAKLPDGAGSRKISVPGFG